MKRTAKWIALFAVGGVLLQASGCTAVLVQLVARNLLFSVISNALSALLGDGTPTEM